MAAVSVKRSVTSMIIFKVEKEKKKKNKKGHPVWYFDCLIYCVRPCYIKVENECLA